MPDLPPELADHLRRLRSLPLGDPSDLRQAVDGHLATAERAAADSAFVDVGLARHIAGACHALLDSWPTLAPANRQLVQAACRYFADPDDDEDDFDSIIGFEDDAELLNHVVAALGRDDLTVELS
jgi:hypothetical protein